MVEDAANDCVFISDTSALCSSFPSFVYLLLFYFIFFWVSLFVFGLNSFCFKGITVQQSLDIGLRDPDASPMSQTYRRSIII